MAGLRHPRELATWPRRGHSFEGLVVEELAVLAERRLTRPELFFWRTQTGAEVDLLIVEGREIMPLEIKPGAAFDHHALAGLRQCMKDLGLRRAWVVTPAREARHILSPGPTWPRLPGKAAESAIRPDGRRSRFCDVDAKQEPGPQVRFDSRPM